MSFRRWGSVLVIPGTFRPLLNHRNLQYYSSPSAKYCPILRNSKLKLQRAVVAALPRGPHGKVGHAPNLGGLVRMLCDVVTFPGSRAILGDSSFCGSFRLAWIGHDIWKLLRAITTYPSGAQYYKFPRMSKTPHLRPSIIPDRHHSPTPACQFWEVCGARALFWRG